MNNNQLTSTILNLWQISRTALCGQPSVPTRYERMIYVKNELIKDHATLIANVGTGKHLWFAIEDAIN